VVLNNLVCAALARPWFRKGTRTTLPVFTPPLLLEREKPRAALEAVGVALRVLGARARVVKANLVKGRGREGGTG